MFSTLRTRFGIPGVISVIALVFAMFGGAYAASNSASGGKATASAKAKKGPRGPKGATGPAGPAGPAGPQGSAGVKGDTGANGTNGTNGTSATTTSFTGSKTVGSVTCEEGGVTVKSASPETAVCNGAAATGGGFPETLPEGATEMGSWSVENATGAGLVVIFPISFPIPLELGLDSDHVVFLEPEEGATTECPGSVSAPEAAAGYLCVYSQFTSESFTPDGFSGEGAIHKLSNGSGLVTFAGADSAGALVEFKPVEEGGEFKNGLAYGSWAVTASEA